jgi:hypothetical protein
LFDIAGAPERLARSAHCTPMTMSAQRFISASDDYQVAADGVSFLMTDGMREVRCRVGRAALEGRSQAARHDLRGAFHANREMIFLLAAQKLSLRGPQDDGELELSSTDLFSGTWQPEKS